MTVSRMKPSVTATTARPQTSMPTKIACQPAKASRRPPIVEETAGPMARMMPIVFMIREEASPVN